MGLWVDLAQAYRRAEAPPNAVQPEEAAAAGFDVRPAVANILSRYNGAHLWRVLFQALRPEAVRYLAAAALLVAVTPLVPVALRSATGALERGDPTATRAAVLVGVAVVANAALRWVCTWRIRRIILLVELCTQRILFRRLANVDQAWLNANLRSTTTYLLTYPQVLSQVAFGLEFVAFSVLIVVLMVLVTVWYGWVAVAAFGATAMLVLVQRRLVIATSNLQQRYATMDHRRAALLEIIARSWQSIRRQYLEAQVLVALRRIRRGQLTILRDRARLAAASRVVEDNLVLVASLVAVGAVLVFGGITDPASAFSLLIVVRMVLSAANDNLSSYRVLRTAAAMTRDIDELFAAPTVRSTRSLALGPGVVEVGHRGEVLRIEPGSRVAVVGSPAVASSALEWFLSGPPTHGPQWSAAYGGSAVLVGRGQAHFDGSLADVVRLWSPDSDALAYDVALRRSGVIGSRTSREPIVLSATEVRLSEGQTVRLSLAQALMARPDVLVLDDVFAPLDPDTAHEVATGILGPGSGPTTSIFLTSRPELVRFADHVLLVGSDDIALARVDALRGGAEQSRYQRSLGVELYQGLRQALEQGKPHASLIPPQSTGTEERQHDAPLPPAFQADAFEAAPAARIRLDTFLRSGAAIFPGPALIAILAGVVVFAGADLGFSVLIERWGPRSGGSAVAALAALVGAAVAAASMRHVLTFWTPIRCVDRLHSAIFRALLLPATDRRRSSMAGRVVRDFFSLEIMAPPTYITIISGSIQSAAAIALIAVGAPLILSAVPLLVLAMILFFKRSQRATLAGANLAAALRGPVTNFGIAALSNAGYRLSLPIRQRLSDRFDHLANLRAAGSHRVMMCRLRILLTVETIALSLFLAALAAAVLVPVGAAVGPGLVLFVAYTFSREFTATVERVQTADTLVAELARLSDILDRATLPRPTTVARDTPDDPRSLYETLVKSTRDNDMPTDPARAPLSALGLSVSSPDGTLLLRDIEFTARRGSTIALIGPSGVGKSLLAQTLAGSREPESGQIQLDDGRPPSVFDATTRNKILVAESDIPLLAVSARDFAGPWNAPADYDHVVAKVFAVAGAQPPAPDRPIDQLGHAERQLLNLARVVLAQPSVLILDEATSALDTTMERRVMLALPDLLPAAAIVTILHRPDNQDCVDQVFTVNAGGLVGGSGREMGAAAATGQG